jgi:hypothetical protein
MAIPFTQYISTDAPSTVMVSAIQKRGMDISNAAFSVTFYVTLQAFGSSIIATRPKLKLRVILNSGVSDQEILVSPTVKEGAVYRYKTKWPNPVTGTVSGTIDQCNITNLELLHGDLYFVVPKQPNQTPVGYFVDFDPSVD